MIFFLQDIISLMEEKFNEYFKYFSIIFYFATFMYPGIKFEDCKYLLEFFYEKNYSNYSLVGILKIL